MKMEKYSKASNSQIFGMYFDKGEKEQVFPKNFSIANKKF